MCRKIDIHTHIIPEHFPNWSKLWDDMRYISLDHHKPCAARMMQGDKFFREIEDNCWSPQRRIEDCTQFGVTQQVLSTIPVMFHYWASAERTLETSVFLNDHISDLVTQYPDHFYGLGTVPLQDPALAAKELERIMKIKGMHGVQIGSHVNDWNLNDPALHEFYAAAEELGASVFVHPWDMMSKEKMQRYWLPWLVGMPAEGSLAICSMIFGGIFEKFPKLRVAFAHGGGAFPATFGRIAHGYEVRPDLVAIDNPIHPKEYLGKFWIDALVHDPDMLKFVVKMFGKEKIALGTDYPFPLGELSPGALIANSDLDEDTKEHLNYKAALSWLGL